MKFIAITLFSIFLSSCSSCFYEADKTEYQKLFLRCLEHIPKGPVSVHYNDWDDVVEECGNQARWQASEVKTCRDIF